MITTAIPMSEKQSPPDRAVAVLLFAHAGKPRVTDESKFDLVMALESGNDAWLDVHEMLQEAKIETKNIKFVIEGILGTKSIHQIKNLSEHGTIKWLLPKKLIIDAAKKIKAEKLETKVTVVECAIPD